MNIKKTIAGLGIGITLLSSGYVGTHEKLGDQWITNAEYNTLKTTLIEKQNESYLTIQEYQLLIMIYDKEAKRGVNGIDLENINKDNLIPKLNTKIK